MRGLQPEISGDSFSKRLASQLSVREAEHKLDKRVAKRGQGMNGCQRLTRGNPEVFVEQSKFERGHVIREASTLR